ncbi:MAG TPA: hypothetical protein DEF47_07570 [Herpetosiphon sp.]|nr:hypothetical protein [Herpetosiphon sp.]
MLCALSLTFLAAFALFVVSAFVRFVSFVDQFVETLAPSPTINTPQQHFGVSLPPALVLYAQPQKASL